MTETRTARWIWKPGPVQINDYALFRCVFEREFRAKKAELRVSAHHYVHLYVNGRRVTGYGSPAPSTPPQTKYELCYDIAALLTPGKNTVSAAVHYLGTGGQSTVDGFPGFLCELNTEDESGCALWLATNEAWEVCGESPYVSGRPNQQNRRLSASELYDGRIAAGTAAWLQGERDDLTSGLAVLSPIETANAPWVLKPQEIPEGREERVLRPRRCGIQRIGHQVFDAGQIISGWVRIRLHGIRGVHVRVRYSEHLDTDGTVSRAFCNESSDTYYDEYIMAGEPDGGTETWQPDFSYKAFRYFEITDFPEWISDEDVEVVWAHTDLGEEGRFACSDPLLNAMFEACIRTQKNNVLGVVADCPHREQAQYLADSDLQAETLIAFFGNARPVLRKVLADFQDVMHPDGGFPFVAPGSTNRPEFNVRIPEWDLHYVSLLWKVYFAYNDVDIVERCYGTVTRLVDALLGRLKPETGLLPKSEYWHISDWPYPKVDQDGPYLTVQNAKFHRALELTAKLAFVVGKAEDASRYQLAAERLKDTMRLHLYDLSTKAWRDCWDSDSISQGVNALTARCGLTPEEDLPNALSTLAREWNCRTVLSLELFRLLFENGEQETAMAWLSRPDYPGWGYMIAQGSPTMWEGFEDIESHSHAWNGYPARFMADYLLGVKAEEPAYARVKIAPYFAQKLTFAEGTVKTLYGDIRVRWERLAGGISLYVEIPPGTSADIPALGTAEKSVKLGEGSHYFMLKSTEVQNGE